MRLAESGRELGELTISIGVTNVTANDFPDSVIQRADDALLSAKRKGRDRVIHNRAQGASSKPDDIINETDDTLL